MKQNRWWHYLLPPGIISLVTFAVYYPSLRYPFLFDDLPNITLNYDIRFFNPKQMFFANSRWISRLLNKWTYHNWQFEPFAYRIVNLLLHITIGILIFTLVIKLLQKSKNLFFKKHSLLFASTTCGLFMLHPVQTQTVTYITQIRLEGLVTLFSIMIILLFTFAATTNRLWAKIALYSGAGLCTIFAAGTKEIIIVLPFLLLLIDWFFIAQSDHKTFVKRLPIHGMLALLLYGTYFWLGSPVKPTAALALKTALKNNRGNILTQLPEQLITPLRYLTSQFRVMLHYLTIFFWPFGLTFDYGWKIPISFWSFDCILPFLFLLMLATTTIILFFKNKTNLISFGLSWFFISILPRSSIIPSSELVCDYKTYLASFGILLLIAYGIVFFTTKAQALIQGLKLNKLLKQFAPSAILLVALAIGAQTHNSVWSSRMTFWKDVIDKTEPHTPARIYNNYAVGLISEKRIPEGIENYKKAISTDQTYAEPHINLALQYQLAKQYNKALEHYKTALTLKEVHPELYNNLGLLHLTMGSSPKAKICFEKAVSLRPYYSKALFNLGKTHLKENNIEQTLQCYEKALQGDNQTIDMYYAHGSLCYNKQKHARGLRSLEKIEALQKNYLSTRQMLANGYYYINQFEKAESIFAHLHTQDPRNLSYSYNYAQTLLKQNKYNKALPLFIQCKNTSQSRFPHTSLHIAKCMHKTGKTEQAKQQLAQFMKSATSPGLKNMGEQLFHEIMRG